MLTKTHININLDNDILRLLDENAKKANMNRSMYLTRVLRDYFTTKDYVESTLPDMLKAINALRDSLKENYNITVPFSDEEQSALLRAVSGSEAGAPNHNAPD